MEITTLHKDELMADDRYVKLASLLTCEYHLALMERLRDTDYYNGFLRNKCNQLTQELRNTMSKDVDVILGIDDKLVYKVQASFEKLMAICASVRPEYIEMIVDLSKKLIENPQAVKEFLNINIYDNTQNIGA